MRAQFGTIVVAASGSVGGQTFSRNRYGPYVRTKAMPVNPNTAFQQAVRTIMAGLMTAWRDTLTDEQRAAWTTYAENTPVPGKFGESTILTGNAMYARCNVPRLQAGLARVDPGPTTFGVDSFTAPVPTADASDDEVSVAYTNTDDWAGEVGGALLIYLSRPKGPGINFFKGPYQYAGKVAGAALPPTSPEVITAPFALAEGQKVFMKVVSVRADGRISSPFRVGATVVA